MAGCIDYEDARCKLQRRLDDVLSQLGNDGTAGGGGCVLNDPIAKKALRDEADWLLAKINEFGQPFEYRTVLY